MLNIEWVIFLFPLEDIENGGRSPDNRNLPQIEGANR